MRDRDLREISEAHARVGLAHLRRDSNLGLAKYIARNAKCSSELKISEKMETCCIILYISGEVRETALAREERERKTRALVS